MATRRARDRVRVVSAELKDKLDEYVARFGGVVRVFHKKHRQGLIRAKLDGARMATGEVVVYLDAHSEANVGWLEPLLQRVKDSRTSIVCPVIDHISAETFAYSGDSSLTAIGSFWWSA